MLRVRSEYLAVILIEKSRTRRSLRVAAIESDKEDVRTFGNSTRSATVGSFIVAGG